MATTQWSGVSAIANDAAYQAFVASSIAALTAVGLVQTDDTGQVDPATAVKPAANTIPDYATFRFDDELQTARPLFIRVGFGVTSQTTNPMGYLDLRVGKGTDGAGTITNPLLGRTLLGNVGNSGSGGGETTARTCVASGGEGWVAFVPWIATGVTSNYSTPLPWFLIERVADGGGVVVVYTQGGGANVGLLTGSSIYGSPILAAINYATGVSTVGLIPVAVPHMIAGVKLGASTALAAGAVGPVFPWVVFVPGLAPAQCRAGLTYPGGDAPAGVFTTRVGRQDHTFFPVPLSNGHNGCGLAIDASPNSQTASRYLGLAIRWE